MSLTLTIVNTPALDNGQPTRMQLDRHGAIIGRSPHVDWSLPDPRHYISSTHCEIDYRDGAYILVDKSTNGVFVNGAQARVAGPHQIRDGDLILVGHYEIAAKLEGADLAAAGAAPKAAPGWGGWDSHAGGGPVGVDPARWDRPAPQAAISGQGPMSEHWAAPTLGGGSSWDSAPAPASAPASDWSSPIADAPAPASAHDVWGQLAAHNTVDWGRGGFGGAETATPAAASLGLGPSPDTGGVAADPFGLAPAAPAGVSAGLAGGWSAPANATALPSTPALAVAASSGWGSEPAAAPVAPAPPLPLAAVASAPRPQAAAPIAGGEWQAFLAGAGLEPTDLKASPTEALAQAGAAMKRLVAGLVVMMEARARAKAQLGAQSTSLEFEGNNPLKFARSPQKALVQLLNPPERGFMPTERAVQDAFQDLQAHQMATLAAMQGALGATLKRFSPEAIRGRAERRGLLAKILPSARDAALWQDYEREFEGVAKGSDEAFMDVFAKEFRQAYDAAAAQMKTKP